MNKDDRGLVKNNKGICKRVYEIEFNHEDKIEKVIEKGGYTVFKIENRKNEIAKPISFKQNKKFYNILNNVKNGKDKKTYVLTCKDELYKGYDNNVILNIEGKTKTDSPICNKAMEGVKSLLSDLNNESDRVFEERVNLEKREEEIEEEIQYRKKYLEGIEEGKKNVRIKLNETINIPNDKDEAHRLLEEYFEMVEETEEIKKSIAEKENLIVPESDIDSEVQKMIDENQTGETVEAFKQRIGDLEVFREYLIIEKVFDFLKENAVINEK